MAVRVCDISTYRVEQVVPDLGWVDFDFKTKQNEASIGMPKINVKPTHDQIATQYFASFLSIPLCTLLNI